MLAQVATPDQWAVGCIFAELLSLRPIFKGEEAKIDPHQSRQQALVGQAGGFFGVKMLPYQSDQMGKIVDILGSPDSETHAALEKVVITLLTSGAQSFGGRTLCTCPNTRNFKNKKGEASPKRDLARG